MNRESPGESYDGRAASASRPLSDRRRRLLLPGLFLRLDLRLLLRLALALLLGALIGDRDELQLEDQHRVGPDVLAPLALPVGEARGDEQLPLRAHRHELEGLRPALDHLGDLEGRRLAAGEGAVELGAVDE